MATIEYWIQLENRQWDASPHNIDRMTGHDMKTATGMDPVDVQLKAPGGGLSTKIRKMFNPARDSAGKVIDVLILRRYKPPVNQDQSDAWTVPDDRKVNPWDLNEPDPTDNGTMGTIPGPVIECNVGDSVVVHFRNMDMREEKPAETITITIPGIPPFIPERTITFQIPAVPLAIGKRVHSLHPHGFVFQNTSDGAYPLSPPDPNQPPISASEAAAWASVPQPPGMSPLKEGDFKRGDRVPPGGTFIYRWNTVSWPSTAGVWHYHDHSICDVDNIELGAIGIIVIHNPEDTEQEVDIRDLNDPTKLDPAFLPDGSPNGSPRNFICIPIPGIRLPILPHDLEGLGQLDIGMPGGHPHALTTIHPRHGREEEEHKEEEHNDEQEHKEEAAGRRPIPGRLLKRGDLFFELDEKLQFIRLFCFLRYDPPPSKALYLQLYHQLHGVSGMMINGRTFMGNTPTMIAGSETRMRFGVVGMGNDMHTFHIHGHRWILPGPQGNTPGAIQGSPQVQAVTQFEDTRIFGPANSFVFTIDGRSGSFMRGGGPSPEDARGEWHMHCHVLNHMHDGMMGSLLIINGGDPAFALPVGVPCGHETGGETPGGGHGDAQTHQVTIKNDLDDGFDPKVLTINVGDSVVWKNDDGQAHTATKTGGPGAGFDTGIIAAHTSSSPIPFNTAGTIAYRCDIHTNMKATIQVNP